MPDPTPDEELAAAQAVEYGTYVATKTIHIRGARAFNIGDPVPVSHVERGIVGVDSVETVDATKPSRTKAAESPTTTEPKGF